MPVGPGLSFERLTGLLWDCTNIMPSDVREIVSELVSEFGEDDPPRPIFTVAQAVAGCARTSRPA